MNHDLYWIFILLGFSMLLFSIAMALQVGFKRGKTSLNPVIEEFQTKNHGLREVIDQLNEKAHQLERRVADSDEWIEVPVILHGLSWCNAAHTFVQLHTKTLELRASRQTRVVKDASYVFEGQPRPVLGGPKWQHIQGNRDEILILGQIYRHW